MVFESGDDTARDTLIGVTSPQQTKEELVGKVASRSRQFHSTSPQRPNDDLSLIV